jgi:hypothetical protein
VPTQPSCSLRVLQALEARVIKAEAELSQVPKLEVKVAHLQARHKLQSRLKLAVQMLKAETARVSQAIWM